MKYACILVGDDDEELVIDVIHKDCDLNDLGEPNVAITIDHSTGKYILKRGLMRTVYIYGPANETDVDNLF